METTIPFQGFYHSFIDGEIDNVIEREAERLEEEHELDGLMDSVWSCANFGRIHEEIAQKYVEHFGNFLAEKYNLQVSFGYKELSSPREYNFVTDRIFATITKEDVIKACRVATSAGLRQKAKERFTSRDGFISFYSPDVRSWGPLVAWDINQVGTIFEAIAHKEEEFHYYMYERMTEDIFNTVTNNIDWPKLEQKIKEAKLEASGEVEPDARKFPTDIADTEHYVKEFVKLNHLH